MSPFFTSGPATLVQVGLQLVVALRTNILRHVGNIELLSRPAFECDFSGCNYRASAR